MKFKETPFGNATEIIGLDKYPNRIGYEGHIDLLKDRVTDLEEALRDIAEDDCGCCDCAQRAREALGMKEGD